MRFFKCLVCGKIIAVVNDKDIPTICCGKEMVELVPNTQDGAKEKHVPIYEVKGNAVHVKVGEIEHPMLENHYIEWVMLKTNLGNQRKVLKPGQKPEVEFALLPGEKVVAVLEYCNLHGLYSTK